MTLAQDLQAVRARLTTIAGKKNVVAGEAANAHSTTGELPAAVVAPSDENQAAEVAKVAATEKIPVVVWGNGTKQGVEPVQSTGGCIVLSTAKLSSTVELDADNLTVTVGSGKVVGELQKELATARLFLPLDPMDSAKATIGGTLATNSSGPNRLLYRTARDLVLGVRVATPMGTVVRAGGKTVKDVAGYDMKKLFIGSWGTLGLITEATFRLLPLPEARATVAMVFTRLDAACAAVVAIRASFMTPSTAELLSAGAPVATEAPLRLAPGEYLLLVQAEGASEDVERMKRELAEVAARHGARAVEALEGEVEAAIWRARKDVLAATATDIPAVLVKGSVPITRVVDFASGVEMLSGQGMESTFAAHAGNGIVYASVSASVGEEAKLIGAVQKLQGIASEFGGFALLQRGPAAVSGRVQLWPTRTDYGVMREIKAQMDPAGLWNPARTPGGRG